VPMKVILDGYSTLKNSYLNLLTKIYYRKEIPDQWRVSRVIPIHKKGSKLNIENYRPISNLCSSAKVYERMILLHIGNLEEIHNSDFTGESQHGFKKNSSTITALLKIQTKIVEELESGKIVGMISLDLSSAFDVVDHDLLVQRMKTAKIPNDVIDLVSCWLSDRSAYVECETKTSFFYRVEKGTVQGSVLGPVLFAIFIAPLLNSFNSTMFADDNYVIETATNINDLKVKIQQKTTSIYKWLCESGMSVNLSKTELIIFSPRKENYKVDICVNNTNFSSIGYMRVLGVWFDNKFTWSKQIEMETQKLTKINFGLRRLRTIFEPEKLLQLATSLGFSKLYYGAPVWLSSNLSKNLLQDLLRASTNTIKSCFRSGDWNQLSFNDIHEIANKATPKMYSEFAQANTIKNIIDSHRPTLLWVKMQNNSREVPRDLRIYFGNESKSPMGRHSFANRIYHVSSKLPPGWENLTKEAFKRLAKTLFLKF